MRNKLAVILSVALVITGAIYAGANHVAWAQQGPPRGEGNPEEMQQRMLAHMTKKLGLSEAQQAQIQNIFAQEKPSMEQNRTTLHNQHEAFRAATSEQGATPGTFKDEALVNSLASQIAQAEAAQMVAHARLQQKIMAVLTPEQRVKAQQLHAGGPQGPGAHGQPPAPPAED